MALKHLVDLDLGGNELQNASLQVLATAPSTPSTGQIYYDSAQGGVFINDGGWKRVGLTADDTTIVESNGIISVKSGVYASAAHNHAIADITGLQTALDGKVDDSQVLTNVPAGAVFTDTQLSTEQVQDIVGGFVSGSGATSVTYNDASNTLVISSTNTTYSAGNGISLSGTTFSVAGGDGLTQEASGLKVDGTVVRTSGDQTIAGIKTFSNNVVVNGDLTVSGTTTTVNSTQVNLADNILTLASNASTSSEIITAGIEVNRGVAEFKPSVFYSEADGRWFFSLANGAVFPIAIEDEFNTNTQLSTEQVQDIVGGFISGSGATTVTYNDASNTLVISSTDTNTQRSNEEIMDVVGSMVTGNTELGIAVTYDDAANELDFVNSYVHVVDVITGTGGYVVVPSSGAVEQRSVMVQVKEVGADLTHVITDWYSDGSQVFAFLPAGSVFAVACSGIRA